MSIISIGQYKIVKSFINSIDSGAGSIYTVWEPCDKENEYTSIRMFNDNLYGMLGSRVSNEQTQEFFLSQRNDARVLISEAYPQDNLENLKWVKSAWVSKPTA